MTDTSKMMNLRDKDGGEMNTAVCMMVTGKQTIETAKEYGTI